MFADDTPGFEKGTISSRRLSADGIPVKVLDLLLVKVLGSPLVKVLDPLLVGLAARLGVVEGGWR